jgi:hypothetical protein
MSLICTSVFTGGGAVPEPPDTPLVRTSLNRNVVVEGGTDQVSVNWILPSLEYVTL